jgi:hypothetical protein
MRSLEVRLASAIFGAAEVVGLVPGRDVVDAAAAETVRHATATGGGPTMFWPGTTRRCNTRRAATFL